MRRLHPKSIESFNLGESPLRKIFTRLLVLYQMKFAINRTEGLIVRLLNRLATHSGPAPGKQLVNQFFNISQQNLCVVFNE